MVTTVLLSIALAAAFGVALAWLAAQPTVAAPIASASKPEQVADLVAAGNLTLMADEVELLSTASEVN